MATALPPSAILAVRDPTAPRTKPKYAWMEPSTTPAKPKYDWMEPSTTPAKVIESSLISIPTLEDVSTEQASNIVGIQSSALPFAMPIGTGPKPETTSSVQASIDEYGRKRLIVKLKFPASGMSRSFIAAQNANHYRQSQKRDVKKSAKRKPLQEEYEEEYQDDDDSDSEYIPGGAAKRRGTTGRRSRRSKTVKLTLAQKEQQEIEAELVRELDDQIRTAMGATGRKPDVPRTNRMAKSKTAEVFDLDIESALQAHLLVNGNPRRATRSATKQAPPTPPAENESQQVPDDTPKTTRALRTTRKPTVKTAEAEAKKAALKKPRGKKAATSTKGEAVRVPSPALEIEPTLESDGESSSELSSARSMSFVPSEFGSVDEPLTPSTLGKIASSEVDGMEIEAAQNEDSDAEASDNYGRQRRTSRATTKRKAEAVTKSATAPRPKRARTSEISKATLDDTKVNESVSQGSHIADQFVVDSNDVSVVANEAQLREPADVVILPALAGAGHVNNMLMAPQVPLMAAYNPPVAWNGVLPIAMQQPAAAPGFHQFQLQPQMVAGPQLFVVNGHQEQRNIFRPPPYENQFYPHPGGGAMYGSAPVWATKRQQLCEALPYYKAYQSGSYTSEGILYAMMIDKERRDTDVLNEEVIITRCGGGRGIDPTTNRRTQVRDQATSAIGLAFLRAYEQKLPVVVIVGSMYHLTPIFQHRYNVLDHFYVTDIWTEIIDNCHTYCARLEKIRLDEKSWWGPKATAVPMHDFVTKAAHHGCGTCGQVSKQIFEEGWVCMNPKCEAYFLLPGLWQQPRNMAYSALFLNERTPWPQNFWLQPLRPALLTELDMVVNSRSGTELVYSKGIVCPECHGCSRRLEFLKWTCENAACNFIYKLPMRSISANEAQLGRTTDENWFDATKVKQSVQVVGSFDLREYGVPGPKGEIIGYMRHYKSNRALNGVANGPDQLFRMMQEEDFGLKRRPVRQPGSTGEIVTAHYASNWGAPYKFVVAQASTPFSQAPPVLIKALKQMTWAGKVAVADGHKEPFHDFNELLSIGYFEGNSIGYHDDGEDTLGPTIATLSLGAQAVMTLRPKAKSEVGGRNTKTQKGLKKEVIKVVLDHGDIIIMHGSELQKHYEHAVKPNGKLRYALTCRYVDPGKLPVHERAEAARLAELPLDHAQHDYRLMDVATLLKDDVARQRSARHIQAARSTLDAFRMLMQDMAPEDLAQIPEINDVAQQYRGIMGRPIFSPAPRQGLVAQGVAVQAPAAQAPAAQATRVAVQGANGQMPVAQIHIPAADAISAESDTETLIGDQQMAAGGDDQPATQL